MGRGGAALSSLLLALVLAQAAPDAGRPQSLFLASLPLASSVPEPVAWGTTALRLTPPAGEASRPAPLFVTRRGLRPVGGSYLVEHLEEQAARDRVLPRHRQPSWVIDYDQPAFRPVLEAAAAELGRHPTVAAVTAFADRYLTGKTYSRGFDLASQVARSRAGDCSEHAVFLAALLRHFGVPARGMLGVILLAGPGEPLAVGHMWVEAWEGGRWVVADAAYTLPGAVRLPSGELEDEGPGFHLGMVRLLEGLGWRMELVPAGR